MAATNVRDVMSTTLVSVGTSATLAEAATLMGARHVSSALVVEDGRPIGIFTERDVVRALAAHHDAARHHVGEWMTRGPVTVAPDTGIDEALEIMLRCDFRHLPVMEGDTLVGLVSIRDLSAAELDG